MRQMNAAFASEAQMAAALGMTERAVAAKRKRLGLYSDRKRAAEIANATKFRLGMIGKKKVKEPRPVKHKSESAAWLASVSDGRSNPFPKPQTTPVELHDVTGCKWPVNDGGPFLFCNAPKDNHNYCDHHRWEGMSAC